MKELRNKVYTLYNSAEVELSENDDKSYHLISRNGIRPDSRFQEYQDGEGIFIKDVDRNEITNAFSVETFASYQGITWQVDRKDSDRFRLSTGSDPKLPDVKMVSQGWYELWVNQESIEKLWEVRKESWFDLPFPDSLDRTFILNPRLI